MGLAHTKKLFHFVLNHNAVEINENDLDTSRKLIKRKRPNKSSVYRKKFKPAVKNYLKLLSGAEEYFKHKPISRFGLCNLVNTMVIAKNVLTSKDGVSYLGNYKHSKNLSKEAKNDTVTFESQPKRPKSNPKNITVPEIKKFDLVKSPFKKVKQEEDCPKLKAPSVRDALMKNNLRLKRSPQKCIRYAHRNFRRAIININALSKRLAAKPITPKIEKVEPAYCECSDSISSEDKSSNATFLQNNTTNLNSEQNKSVKEEVGGSKTTEKSIEKVKDDQTVNVAKSREQIPEECSQMKDKMECKVTEKIVHELKLTYSNSNMSITSSCTTPSETAKACVKYRKTAEQALSHLNDQVSSVLRNTLCSIDDIRQRVHTTVTEINANELHYQYLKTHPNSCAIRSSEPIKNVNELDIKPQVIQTQSENPVINHPDQVQIIPSFEELFDDESKTSVEIPANKCQAMSTLPKIVSLGMLLHLTPSTAEQKMIKSVENRTKIDTSKNARELAEQDDATKTCLLRIEAHRDLHTILVQEMETENENSLEPQKTKTKSLKSTKRKSQIIMDAEELFVPDRQINKILTNSEVLAENTFSLTSPQYRPPSRENKKNSKLASLCTKSKSLVNSSNDSYEKTLKKYSDSLWFSAKTKRKIKMTKEVVQSKDGSETVMKLAASKSSVVIENSVVQTDDTIKTPRRCNILSVNYKNRLNCFDILDEITLNDLKPIEPEYPRKDHIGTNRSSVKVEKTFLYKLVYSCSNQYFMEMINVQVPQPNCSFPNCLLCRSAYQSLRNGNKYCQTEVADKHTAVVKREKVNPVKITKPPPSTDTNRTVAPKRKRRVQSDTRKTKIKKEITPEMNTVKKIIEKDTATVNYPTEKRRRRHTIADVEVITEKLRPFMLDPYFRYRKNVTVAHTSSANRKCTLKKNAPNEVVDKLHPYIFDLKDRHFKTYTVMPVFVSTSNKEYKRAPLEVRDKLRPYMWDPTQNHFCAIRAMPVMVSNPHKLKSKANTNINFEAHCTRCHSHSQMIRKTSRLSTATSSSSEVGKLQHYMCDKSRKFPIVVTAMPATVTTFENFNFDASSISSKMQKGSSHGDYPTHGHNKPTSKSSSKQHFPKAQFKSSASLDKSDSPPKARSNAASNLISFLTKQNLIQPQQNFGDNLSEYLRQKPMHTVGVALTSKTPKKSVSSKLEHEIHPHSHSLITKSQTISKSSNETVRPTTPKTQARARNRKPITPRVSPHSKSQKEIEKMGSTKNVLLENNIQNVIDMIETKIIDIISSPDKTHSETFNNVEQEIIQILDTIRQVETKPLNTIEECADAKGSQGNINVLHNKGKHYHVVTPNDSSTQQTKSELSKKGSKFFQFESNKKKEHYQVTSACSPKQSCFFTDVNSSVEKLERTVDYLEADQQQYHAPTKSETLKNLAAKSRGKPNKQKVSKSERIKTNDNEEVKKIDKEEVQKIIEKRVESINEIINKLNQQELNHDQDVENKLKTIAKISEISLTNKISKVERNESDVMLETIPSETTNKKSNDDNDKVVKNLYVNDGKNQDTCDKEVSTTTLDFELTKNEEHDVENNKMVKCNSSYYLTPFMKALIKYRNEDTAKSSSILDFLDTLTTISTDSPSINKLLKMNIRKKITISEILQIKKIYYPAEIYHPISVYSNSIEKTDERWLLSLFGNIRKRITCKPIERKEDVETPKLCSTLESSMCVVEPPKEIGLNLIEIKDVMYDDQKHGSFLNSLYSALFAAVFFSFTLNYSCH